MVNAGQQCTRMALVHHPVILTTSSMARWHSHSLPGDGQYCKCFQAYRFCSRICDCLCRILVQTHKTPTVLAALQGSQLKSQAGAKLKPQVGLPVEHMIIFHNQDNRYCSSKKLTCQWSAAPLKYGREDSGRYHQERGPGGFAESGYGYPEKSDYRHTDRDSAQVTVAP